MATITRPVMYKTVPEILEESLNTFRERGQTYGECYKMHGHVMRALFPNGLGHLTTAEQLNMLGIINMIVSKLTRLTVGDMLHSDSAHDISVYGAMLEELILSYKEVPLPAPQVWQCESVNGRHRCSFMEGHSGMHADGNTEWVE